MDSGLSGINIALVVEICAVNSYAWRHDCVGRNSSPTVFQAYRYSAPDLVRTSASNHQILLQEE